MAMVDALIADYLGNMAGQNARTAITVGYYLKDFEEFAKDKMQSTVSRLVADMKEKKLDVYAVLQKYTSELNTKLYATGKNTAKTINYKIKYAKRLLEFHDVEITQSKFRIKVKLPKNVDPELTPLDKAIIRTVLNACDDLRLKTFVLWLATSGWRAKESLSLKLENFDFNTNPITVSIHGKYTKTKKSRHTWLTAEMAAQLNEYLNWKYRPRRINAYRRGSNGEYVTKLVMPERRPSDHVFLIYHDEALKDHPRKLEYAYNQLNERFTALIKRLKIGKELDSRRSKVTFHSFRRHVYTTIDGLGHNQFAEFFIAHKTSEYWNKPESEKIATFKKVEPYLTYLDVTQMETATADLEAQVGALRYDNMQLKGQVADAVKTLKEMEPWIKEAQKNSRAGPMLVEATQKLIEENARLKAELEKVKKKEQA
jgi:integrase